MKKEKEERRGMGNRARTLRPASSPPVTTWPTGGYAVWVLPDCITSYDIKKIPEMLTYYASKGCTVDTLAEAMA